MKVKIGNCLCCGRTNISINSRGKCSDCIFKENHNGLSRFEVAILKEKDKVKGIYNIKRKRLKSGKNKPKTEDKNQFELDEITYEQVFKLKPSFCEECGCNLPDQFRDEDGKVIMRSQYSHCLGKKAYGEYRNKSWNIQRLCFKHHQQWDFSDKKSMKIYPVYKKLILEKTGRDILD